MPFCPKCGYEYKLGMTKCPDCGVGLTGSPRQNENRFNETNGKLKSYTGETKLLYNTHDMMFAGMLQEALESAGIPCLIKRSIGIYGHVSAVLPDKHSVFKIWVPRDLYAEALEIKEGIFGEN